MADFLPDADLALRAWVGNFAEFISANAGALALSPVDVTAVSDALVGFEVDLAAQDSAEAAARAATRKKNDRRESVESIVRSLVRRVQASESIDDAQRQAMGVVVRDLVKTRAPAPMTRPVVSISVSQALRHVLRFSDEAMPTRRARPRGAIGAEIWMKVAPAGAGEAAGTEGLTFVQLATASPCEVQLNATDIGKTARYCLRWVNTRGERGPWSAPAMATIAG